jgi:dynein heavy chain
LIENLDEDIEPVLDPLLGRVLIKKGKAIRLGDKEIFTFFIQQIGN